MPDITVGLRVPHELPGGAAGLRDFVARAEATGIDRLFTGDHVMFQGGHGFDGLLTATAVAVASGRLTMQTAVYLLPLRHPVPVARQVAISPRSRRGGWSSALAWAARTRPSCAPAASTRPPGDVGWTRRWRCCGYCWRARRSPCAALSSPWTRCASHRRRSRRCRS